MDMVHWTMVNGAMVSHTTMPCNGTRTWYTGLTMTIVLLLYSVLPLDLYLSFFGVFFVV